MTQRGNRRGRVFFTDDDRRRYLRLLHEHGQRYGLRLWSYALMDNHVHLLVVPTNELAMARTIGVTHRKHSVRINHREGWTGHLWGGRYHSSPLDPFHLWAAARYIELNPVKAKIVERAEDYRWSSAAVHAHGRSDALLDSDRPFPGHVADWSAWLRAGLDDPTVETIRRNTRVGRPTGSEAFVRECEARLGRSLRPRRRGPRPGAGND